MPCDGCPVRLGQACSRFDQRLQHGLQVESGPADRLKHVGCRGLLLKSLAQLLSTRLYHLEKPHVLDRDHSLVREGRDELDLLFREGPRLRADEAYDANRHPFAQHRNPDDGPKAAELLCLQPSVIGIVVHVRDVGDLTVQQRAADGGPFRGLNRNRSGIIDKLLREPIELRPIEDAVSLACDGSLVGVAQVGRRLDERLQHALEVEGRAADGLQHVGGCGLLLEGFAQSSVRARTSSKRATLLIAITAWSAKVVTRSIWFAVKGSGVPFPTKMTPTTVPSLNSGTPIAAR